jgi:hypothetical protein
MEEIRLTSSDSISSINEEQNVSIELRQTTKKNILTNINAVVDAYETYQRESSASTKYRLTLTINPFCTNVLFNTCTEIVANDGAYETTTQGQPEIIVVTDREPSKLPSNVLAKNVCGRLNGLKRAYMVDNTEYSSENIGFTYYPGYDIFGNHRLRNLSFRSVIPIVGGTSNQKYNTIEDTMRNIDGSPVKFVPRMDYGNTSFINKHLYDISNILPMENGESVSANLTNQNGWYGFYNNSSITPKKIGGKTVVERDDNHVINNKGNCEFVDMYPDRTLYSFNPKMNPHKRRMEKNWDIWLTYPYENFYHHNLVSNTYANDGTSEGDKKTNALLIMRAKSQINRNGMKGIEFRTFCKHNLSPNDYVQIYYSHDNGVHYTACSDFYRVSYIGDMKNENKDYYFATIDSNILSEVFSDKMIQYFYTEIPIPPVHYRIVNGDIDEIPQNNDNTDSDYEPNICRYFYDTATTLPIVVWDSGNTVDDFPHDVQNGPQYIRKRIPNAYQYFKYENEMYNILGNDFNPDIESFGKGNTFDDIPVGYISDYIRVHQYEYYEATYKFYEQKEGNVEEIVNKALKNDISLRFAKISNGLKCEYYIRKFRKLPNFAYKKEEMNDSVIKNHIKFDEYVEKNATKDGKLRNFSCETYPLAFANTIYGDPITQYQFVDTMDIYGIKDNLNRPITEMYATVVKKNVGYDEWYNKHKYSDYTASDGKLHRIEYSHCFGKVTSGFEFMIDETDDSKDRERKAFLSDACLITNIPSSWEGIEGEPLEWWGDINVKNGATEGILEDDVEFFGDVVEYNPFTVSETTISDVHFRFNTAQRENGDKEDYTFTYKELIGDDYTGQFETEEKKGGRSILCPEGYHYKAHYNIPLRSFGDDIRQSSHYSMSVISAEPVQMDGIFIKLKTNQKYNFGSGNNVFICNDSEGLWYNSSIVSCEGSTTFIINPISKDVVKYEGKPYLDWIETCELINNGKLRIRVANEAIPDYARNIGTNLFLWRDIVPASESGDNVLSSYPFANGALYIDKSINFFLKRQDPEGLGNLYYMGEDGNFPDVEGKTLVESNYEYIPETDFIC